MPVFNGMHYLDSAEGAAAAPARTLVCLHGFFMDSRMFRHQTEAFRDTFRVICPDLPAFGGTPAGDVPFTLGDIGERVFALLTHLGIDRFSLAGMSMGGYIALRMALAHPARLESLILIATQAGCDNPETVAAYQALTDNWGTPAVRETIIGELLPVIIGEHPDECALWHPVWSAYQPAGIARPMHAMLTREEIDPSRIRVPSLIIHGTDDHGIPVTAAQACHRAIAGSELVLVEGARHAVNLTHPTEVNQAMQRFLDAHAAH